MALPSPVVTAAYYGESGGATNMYYWVQAIYPWGRSPFSNYALVVTPATLSHLNVVGLNWSPIPGAIAYDIVRTTSTAIPASGTIGLKVYHTANNYKDDGTSLFAYSVVGTGQVNLAYAVYDFAVDGGVAGEIVPVRTFTIPAYSIIIGAWFHVITAVVGSSSTLALGTHAGSATNSIKTAVAEATLVKDYIAIGTATAAAPVRITADGAMCVVVGTSALTAGVVEIFALYVSGSIGV